MDRLTHKQLYMNDLLIDILFKIEYLCPNVLLPTGWKAPVSHLCFLPPSRLCRSKYINIAFDMHISHVQETHHFSGKCRQNNTGMHRINNLHLVQVVALN